MQPEETYSRQAEALLLGGPKRNRIINAAGQGYSPSTYLAYLQAEGFDLEPNLILVQVEPFNDVTDEALLRVVDGADHGLEVRGGTEYRILALGDSIGFGFGVQPEETYSRQAEALLLGGPKRNRIINAAGQGYSPSTYLAYLQAEGFDLEPNLILVQVEPFNDVTDEALLRVVDGADHGLEVRGGRYCVTWDGNLLGSFTMGPYFYERTYLYTMLTRRLLETLGRLFPRHSALSAPGNLYYHMGFDRFLFTSARLESGWTQSQAALSQIRELAGRRGSSLVLLLTPTLYAFHENRTLNGFGNLLIDRMTDWARQESIDYIDPRAALAENGGTALFTDFAHYTPEGHWVLGREIARHLRDNEWKMED